MPRKRRPAFQVAVRKAAVRLDGQAADRVRSGHPWVFHDSIRGGLPRDRRGLVELLDPRGRFVARGYLVSHGLLAVRVLASESPAESLSALVRRCVDSALALRRQHVPPDTTAYRLLHGDGEGLSGISVDRYGRFGVLYLFCPEADFLVGPVCETLGSAAGLRGIYLQERFRSESRETAKQAKLVWGSGAEVEELVTEDGLVYGVDVRAPLNVGLFCDQRENRRLVRRLARGRRVLNLFSYTGAFSVAAAAGGALQVTSVDLSRRYQAQAQHNFRLNQLDPGDYEFVAAEALSVLTRWARRRNRKYDLIVLDPPTFSTSKRGPLSVRQDYPELLAACLQVLAPEGLVLASNNTHNLSEQDFARLLAEGARRAGRRVVTLRRLGLPPDFPIPPTFAEGHYLKVHLLQAL